MNLKFTIPGKPKGKARARIFRNKSGKMMAATPEQTANYENLIKVMFLSQRPKGFNIIEGSCHVYISAYFARAKSNKMITPMIKPDADNIIKVVLDAMNGLVYRDDKQVTGLTFEKVWTLPDMEERVEVVVIWTD